MASDGLNVWNMRHKIRAGNGNRRAVEEIAQLETETHGGSRTLPLRIRKPIFLPAGTRALTEEIHLQYARWAQVQQVEQELPVRGGSSFINTHCPDGAEAHRANHGIKEGKRVRGVEGRYCRCKSNERAESP